MWSDDEIKGKVLHKLTRQGKFHHSHTSVDNLPKGFPKEIRGRVKGCVQKLVKEGLLLTKPTDYGTEVSINTEQADTIDKYIEIFHEKE